jgi:hypothetical protein
MHRLLRFKLMLGFGIILSACGPSPPKGPVLDAGGHLLPQPTSLYYALPAVFPTATASPSPSSSPKRF